MHAAATTAAWTNAFIDGRASPPAPVLFTPHPYVPSFVRVSLYPYISEYFVLKTAVQITNMSTSRDLVWGHPPNRLSARMYKFDSPPPNAPPFHPLLAIAVRRFPPQFSPFSPVTTSLIRFRRGASARSSPALLAPAPALASCHGLSIQKKHLSVVLISSSPRWVVISCVHRKARFRTANEGSPFPPVRRSVVISR